MTGTGLAQAIPIAVSPILTRLYSPAEFGMFALYMSIASITVVVVTGRYELAILLPKRDRDALHIVVLSALLSIVLSVALLVLIIVFNRPIANMLGDPGLANWLYWVPASTLLMGVYQSLNYWCNRKGLYKQMSVNRTLQSGSASVAQLGGGYTGAGVMGLVGGQLSGQALSTSVLALRIWCEEQQRIQCLDKRRLVVLAKRYINFPKFLIVAHGFNTATGQMPIILFNTLFNAATAGFYMLIQRVQGAPMALVAGAIGDVFRQEASHAYIHQGNCKEIYQKTFRRLVLISFAPFLLLFFIAPDLFSWVFGEKWRLAGEYAKILMPMFFLQFIVSPISQVVVFAGKQKIDLVWQIFLILLITIGILIGVYFNNTKIAIILISVFYSIMYVIAGFVNYRLSSGRGLW